MIQMNRFETSQTSHHQGEEGERALKASPRCHLADMRVQASSLLFQKHGTMVTYIYIHIHTHSVGE